MTTDRPRAFQKEFWDGVPYTLDNILKRKPKRPSYIEACAIQYKDRVWTGRTHNSICSRMYRQEKILAINIPPDMVGFITDNGVFCNRISAARIAIKAKQAADTVVSLHSYDIVT